MMIATYSTNTDDTPIPAEAKVDIYNPLTHTATYALSLRLACSLFITPFSSRTQTLPYID